MNHFALFAKHWAPGTVKTRLAASIGTPSACELARRFVELLANRFANTGDCRSLVFTPRNAAPAFQVFAGLGWHLTEQGKGDLGARLRAFFDTAFARGASKVVVIGSDSPTMPLEFVQQAFSALADADVVLGPTDDGGYYVVGARERTPPIFSNIPWSTPGVWRHTIMALEEHYVRYCTMPQWYDVDELSDLIRLESELQSGRVESEWEALRTAVAAALAGVRESKTDQMPEEMI